MNRRSMLSFLGFGAAAGPAVAQQMINVPYEPRTTYGYTDDMNIIKSSSAVLDHKNYINNMQEELSIINADPAKWIAERALNDMKDYMQGYSGVGYNQIDPDIRNMKSITELAKMRIYYERRAKRAYEIQKNSLTHRIAEALGFKS